MTAASRKTRVSPMTLGLATILLLGGCGPTNAEQPPTGAGESTSGQADCLTLLPEDLPVPRKLSISSCNTAGKMTGLHGKAPLPKDVDQAFAELKARFKDGGFTVYDNSHNDIRSLIFGGTDRRKGELQMRPKDGALSVSINLYPAKMKD
ncbi:MAG: hypothetical protein R3C52_10750 [Hyphomonadaceae bacterium]